MKIASEPKNQTAIPGTKAPRTSTSANIGDLPQQPRGFQQARPQHLASGERGSEHLAFPPVLSNAGKGECPTAQGARFPRGLHKAPAGRMKKSRRGACEQA